MWNPFKKSEPIVRKELPPLRTSFDINREDPLVKKIIAYGILSRDLGRSASAIARGFVSEPPYWYRRDVSRCSELLEEISKDIEKYTEPL